MAESPQIGKYRVIAELGAGGFATVYRAVDTTLGRQVALKVLHPQLLVDQIFVQRFYQEARTIAALRHPHIITVYEIGEAAGRLFIAMDLAQGSLAATISEQGSLPWDETLGLVRSMAAALDYAHAQNVVHRDFKPANVLLDAAGSALISDFGFARLLGDTGLSVSISGSAIVGTPGYIAPEVWDSNAATPAADIYALGCVAYELISGKPLFSGATPMQAMRAHDRGPQYLPGWAAHAPYGIEDVLSKALAREPEERYPTAIDFWRALSSLGSAGAATVVGAAALPTSATPAPVTPTLGRPAQPARPAPTPVFVETPPPLAPTPTPTALGRPSWLLPAMLVGALVILGSVGVFVFGRGGEQSDTAVSTTQTAQIVALLETSRAEGAAGARAEREATETAEAQATSFAAEIATAEVRGEQRVIQTAQAQGTQTAQANAAIADQNATAAAVTPTGAPAVEGPTTTASSTAEPAVTRSPQSTRPPTATTAPAAQLSRGDVQGGRGQFFEVSGVDGPAVNPDLVSTGGSCFQGTVRSSSGERYSAIFVQASNGSRTVPANSNDGLNYQVCGLSAGQWGVAVYEINGVSLGEETARNQARVVLSGTSGEVYYINFKAKVEPTLPTLTPLPQAQPTAVGLFDGFWTGKLTGQTATGPLAADGKISFRVRDGAIIGLGASGASCFWNHDTGLVKEVSSGSFSFTETPNQDKATNTRSYTVQGAFNGGSQASGTLTAVDAAGTQCIVGGTWTATKTSP